MPESVAAQERISAHYPSGASDPAGIITAAGKASEVRAAASEVGGVARVEAGDRTPDGRLAGLSVVLKDAPDSRAAKDAIDALRDAVHAVDGADALVGGTTAQTLDTQRTSDHDLRTVIPVVLAVVLLILIGLCGLSSPRCSCSPRSCSRTSRRSVPRTFSSSTFWASPGSTGPSR